MNPLLLRDIALFPLNFCVDGLNVLLAVSGHLRSDIFGQFTEQLVGRLAWLDRPVLHCVSAVTSQSSENVSLSFRQAS